MGRFSFSMLVGVDAGGGGGGALMVGVHVTSGVRIGAVTVVIIVVGTMLAM